MYDGMKLNDRNINVTGPCEFLVMYDQLLLLNEVAIVTGPCEFLVMYKKKIKQFGKQPNCFIFSKYLNYRLKAIIYLLRP